jgi:hypothetical protein
MNIDQITTLVDGTAYDAGTQVLTVRDTDFAASDDIRWLLRTILNTGAVQLTTATRLPAAEGYVAYRGYAAGIPGLYTGPVTATAVFSLLNDEPQVVLAYDLPLAGSPAPPPPDPANPGAASGPAAFTTYFPALRNTFYETVQIAPQNPLPRFIFSSAQMQDPVLYPGAPLPLARGLNFHGSVLPGGPGFLMLGSLLGGLAATPFTGPIQVLPSGPVFSLGMDATAPLSQLFQRLDLHAQMELMSYFAPDGRGYRAGVRLSVPFDLGESRGLVLETTVTGMESAITLLGRFQNVPLPGPADLAGWIGGDGFQVRGLLPAELQPASIYLDSMWATLNPTGPSVDAVGLEVGTEPGRTWEVVPGYLGMGDFRGRFEVLRPFTAPSPRLTLMGTLSVPPTDPAFRMTAGVMLPDGQVFAFLEEPLDLAKLAGVFLPQVKDAPSLIIDEMRLLVNLGQSPRSYTFMGAIRQPWTFHFGGSEVVSLQELYIEVGNRGAGGGTSAFVRGRMELLGLRLSAEYDLARGFKVGAQVPDLTIDLADFARRVVGTGYDFPWLPTFTLGQSEILITHQNAAASSTLAVRSKVQVQGLPGSLTLAFQAVSLGSSWAFAAAADLRLQGLSQFPGLAGLAPLDEVFRLEQLMLMLVTADMPASALLDGSQFTTPDFSGMRLRLPGTGAGLLQAGLYVTARARLDLTQPLRMMRQFLQLEAELGVMVFLGRDPAQDARLTVSLPEVRINDATRLTGSFGAVVQGGQVGLFLAGTVRTVLDGQPLTGSVSLQVVENGAFLSASLEGTLHFGNAVEVGDLALVAGISFEGIPSLGIACRLTAGSFDTALAAFFDSSNPSRSMLMGSMSELTLGQVLRDVAGAGSDIADVLDTVGLLGTGTFRLPSSVADALNDQRLDEVSAAFAAAGVPIPSSITSLHVVNRDPVWFVTDLVNRRHYQLRAENDAVTAVLEPQFYLAPQTVTLGALPAFPQGFFLSGRVRLLDFDASATVEISPSRGLAVDAALAPIVVGKLSDHFSVFSLTAADGNGGPRVSISSFAQPQQAEERFRAPHFYVTGRMELLGLSRSVFATVSSDGLEFAVNGTVFPAVTLDLHGKVGGSSYLEVGGSVQVGLDAVDLGPLGTIHIDTGASGTLDVKVDSHGASATVSASVQFAGNGVSLPPTQLTVDAETLSSLPETLWGEVKSALGELFADPEKWARYVKDGFIQGVEDVAGVLEHEFGIDPDEARKIWNTVSNTAGVCAVTTATALL